MNLLVFHRRYIDPSHIAVDPDHGGKTGGEVQVRATVLYPERKQFTDIHLKLPKVFIRVLQPPEAIHTRHVKVFIGQNG
jgi:hypothetical protein